MVLSKSNGSYYFFSLSSFFWYFVALILWNKMFSSDEIVIESFEMGWMWIRIQFSFGCFISVNSLLLLLFLVFVNFLYLFLLIMIRLFVISVVFGRDCSYLRFFFLPSSFFVFYVIGNLRVMRRILGDIYFSMGSCLLVRIVSLLLLESLFFLILFLFFILFLGITCILLFPI